MQLDGWHRSGRGDEGANLSLKACTTLTFNGVMWQAIIHTIFILSAIGIAYTDKLMTYTASKREHVTH